MGFDLLDVLNAGNETNSAADQAKIMDAYRRVRWNASVLGMLAHPMSTLHGDPAIAVPPADAGTHLRWRFDPLRGWPTDGFYLYRRPHQGHFMPAVRSVDFTTLPAAGPASQVFVPFFGTKRLRLTHGDGVRILAGGAGLLLPDTSTALRMFFPVSVHDAAIRLARSAGPIVLQGYHGNELVFHSNVAAGALEPPTCFEMIDELRINGANAAVVAVQAVPVYIDNVGWEPIGRVPPLGSPPYDAPSIVRRLGPDGEGTPDDEREDDINSIIDSIRRGATADPVSWVESTLPRTSSIEIEGTVLVDLMSLRPRVARAFGLYAVDAQPLVEAADYMVVAAWCRPSGIGALGIALFEDRDNPPAPAGVRFSDLVQRLVDNPGLLYCAPLFHVSSARALAPVAPATPNVVVGDETRRQLDVAGNALLEAPLLASWDLAIPPGAEPPPLARQFPSLATIEWTVTGNALGEELGSPRVGSMGVRESQEIISIPVDALPTTASVRVTSVDLFGVRSVSATSLSTPFPAELYPTAPPPAAFTGALVRAGTGIELHSAWVWGGRSALFHPGVNGFYLEWLQDLDLPAGQSVREALDASAAWRALPRIAPLAQLDFTIDSVADAQLTLATLEAQLVHAEQTPKALGPLYAGVRTSLSIAEAASGRLNGWSVGISGQTFIVTHHTIGGDAWLYFKLPAADTAIGTPFEGMTIDAERPDAFLQNIVLTPVDDDKTTIIGVSGGAQALAALMPGALVTQVVEVFGVLARTSNPSNQVIVSTAYEPQQPGATSARRLPATGGAKVAGVQTDVRAIPATAPTRDRPLRRVFVRARTQDRFGRQGGPSTPFEVLWTADFPPVPAAGPVVDRGSPSDALGQCRLVVSFNNTLQHCGAELYRSTDEQIRTTWERWLKRARASVPADQWTLFGLPNGFVWPPGLAAPSDVTNPLTDFATLPDSMRIFINTLRARPAAGRADAVGRRVFDEAFERRGRMWRAAAIDGFVATNDGERLEFLDLGERVRNKYYYRATLVDAIQREGDPSGVSLPGQGLDISAPEAPKLLPPLIIPSEMVVRWNASRDQRVTRYQVIRRQLADSIGSDQLVGGSAISFAASLRVEGASVSLPTFPPDGTPVAKLDAPTRSLLTEGRLLAKEGRFILWYADGNRAALDITDAAGNTTRTTTYPAPLTVDGGVVNTAEWNVAGTGATLSMADGTGDVTAMGTWRAAPFLCTSRLEEGTPVVLELTSTDTKVDGAFVRRATGRCPAAPTDRLVTVTDGVIDLTDLMNANERVTGVYLASSVTLATASGTPDPELSGAMALMSQVKSYLAGFVRRLRENVSVVFMFTPLAEAAPRFVGHQRRIVFSGGRASVPPWNESVETLAGVFERSALSIIDGVVTGTDTATNLLYSTVSQPKLGRVLLALPDGSEVVARSADAVTEVRGRSENLVWDKQALRFEGLLDAPGSVVSHLFDATVGADGTVTVDAAKDRLADATGTPQVAVNNGKNMLSVVAPIESGLGVTARYQPRGAAAVQDVTADPRRCEQSFAIDASYIGRRFEMTVQAFCDFPAPVGEVKSLISSMIVEIPPPRDAHVAITSASWLETGELEVMYGGSPGMQFKVQAESAAGRVYVLADDVTTRRVATNVDINNVRLPSAESFSVVVIGRYPNDPARKYRAEQMV
jgi:hypothetical protein